MIVNKHIIICTVTVHIQFPHKLPALCKKCCCERQEQKNEDDVPSDKGVAGAPSHAVVASGSFSSVFSPDVVTPDFPPTTTLRISTSFSHSTVFVQKVTTNDQEKPSCRLSYLADARYCILDVETPETPGNGIHGVEMGQMTMTFNATASPVTPDGLMLSQDYKLGAIEDGNESDEEDVAEI